MMKLIEQELYSEPFLVYDCRDERSGHKISINNLDYSKLLLLQEGHLLTHSRFFKYVSCLILVPKNNVNFEFESGSMGSLLNFTKASKGLTIIPYLASLDLG